MADPTVPTDIDGIPQVGPLADAIHARQKEAHDAYMEYLRTDPNPWPDRVRYKGLMVEARRQGIADYYTRAADGEPQLTPQVTETPTKDE